MSTVEGCRVPAIATIGAGAEPFGAGMVRDAAPCRHRLPSGPLVRDEALVAQRRTLGRRKAEILAAIHALPVPARCVRSASASPTGSPGSRPNAGVERSCAHLRLTPQQCDPQSTSCGRRNLHRRARCCIVHGDYRTGNLLYAAE